MKYIIRGLSLYGKEPAANNLIINMRKLTMKTIINSIMGGGKLVLFLFAGAAFAAQPATQVNCTGNPSDTALIQTAINNAGTNDTLKLNGTCQLQFGSAVFITKSNLTITGAGAAGGWSTVIKSGSTDGHPAGVGFVLGDGSGNSVISNVTISNLKFSTFGVAVLAEPQVNLNTIHCTDAIGNGSASNVKVKDNFFVDNARMVESFGASKNLAIRNNQSNSIYGSISIYLGGKGLLCLNDAEETVLLRGLGTPTNASISGNTFSANLPTNCQSIVGYAVDGVDISYNTIASQSPVSGNARIEIFLQNSQNSRVVKNNIDGKFATPGQEPIGFLALDYTSSEVPFFQPSDNDLVADNTFSQLLFGVIIGDATTGYSVVNNKFINSIVSDVYLVEDRGRGPSHDNKVVTSNFSNTVIDLGVNNKLLGTQKFLNNPNIPQSLKDSKIFKAIGRPTTLH